MGKAAENTPRGSDDDERQAETMDEGEQGGGIEGRQESESSDKAESSNKARMRRASDIALAYSRLVRALHQG